MKKIGWLNLGQGWGKLLTFVALAAVMATLSFVILSQFDQRNESDGAQAPNESAKKVETPITSTAFHANEPDFFNDLDKMAKLEQCLALLKEVAANNPELVQQVLALIKQAKADGTLKNFKPEMMIVSYRMREGKPAQVVLQFFLGAAESERSPLKEFGYAHARLGNELFESAERFMGMMYTNITYLGDPEDVQRFERAFASGVDGDMTLIREQTVEPLRVLALVPQGYHFLPESIRSGIHSFAVKAELTLSEWRAQLELLARDPDGANHVGRTVLTWREMAGMLAAVHAGSAAGEPLRNFVKGSTVNVMENQVVTTGALQTRAVVRGSKEVAGHAPSMVSICHNGRTIQVPESAVQAHLMHGDKLGPCGGNGKIKICFEGKNLEVVQADLVPYLARGAFLGACDANIRIPVCHQGQTIEVGQAELPEHLAHGDTLGPCPGDQNAAPPAPQP